MRKVTLIFLILFSGFVLFAFDNYKLDINSSEIEQIKELFVNEPSVGNFKQTKLLGTSQRKFESYGRIQINPGLGVVWFTQKPYKSILIVGKDFLTQKIRNQEPVHLEIAKNQIYLTIAQCIDNVFSGNFNELFEIFDLICQYDENSWIIDLYPKNQTISSFIKQIKMSGSYELSSIRIFETSGDSVLYEISDLEHRQLTDEELEIYNL